MSGLTVPILSGVLFMGKNHAPWFWRARGLWCVEVGGRRHVLARGRGARAEAMRAFYRLMGRVAEVRPSDDLAATVVFEAFLSDVDRRVQDGSRAPVTYERYVALLSAAARAFGEVRSSDLIPAVIEEWVAATTWGPTTRFNAITAVKAAYRWAHRRGYLSRDPLATLSRPAPRRRGAVLSDLQCRTILNATSGPWRDFLGALWLTGCRPSEVATLEADQVDLERGVWNVRNKTRTSTGQPTRPVPLVPELLALSRRLIRANPSGPIFRNARGNPWTRNAIALGFRRLRARHGFGPEASAYAIRHRFAVEALRQGLSTSDLAALMGHTSTRLIDSTYGHWDEQVDRLRDAIGRVRPGEGSNPAEG
jgi:integrase